MSYGIVRVPVKRLDLTNYKWSKVYIKLNSIPRNRVWGYFYPGDLDPGHYAGCCCCLEGGTWLPAASGAAGAATVASAAETCPETWPAAAAVVASAQSAVASAASGLGP